MFYFVSFLFLLCHFFLSLLYHSLKILPDQHLFHLTHDEMYFVRVARDLGYLRKMMGYFKIVLICESPCLKRIEAKYILQRVRQEHHYRQLSKLEHTHIVIRRRGFCSTPIQHNVYRWLRNSNEPHMIGVYIFTLLSGERSLSISFYKRTFMWRCPKLFSAQKMRPA